MSKELVFPGYPETRGRPRKHKNKSEKQKAWRNSVSEQFGNNIATLDFETNPFDNARGDEVFPFAACFYTEIFGAYHFWNDDFEALIEELCEFLEELEERYTIYAHNGGRFDFRFLMHKISGKCLFKGSQLVKGRIGKHELRDSLAILPMPLKSYMKDDFDYNLLRPARRNKPKNKALIKSYMQSDCEYLYDLVKAFRDRFGPHLTVGAAAMQEIKKVVQFDTLSERVDETMRRFYRGGRVECPRGRGIFHGDFKLYDVNSMYPFVMSEFEHPIGAELIGRRKGGINDDTWFIELTCRNRGAFATTDDDGLLTFTKSYGRFFVTIHEFNAAVDLGLIDIKQFHMFIDTPQRSNFKAFVDPLYEERFKWKAVLKSTTENSEPYLQAKQQDLLIKFVLNSGYGKFAWNPRNAVESVLMPLPRDSFDPPPGFEPRHLRYTHERYEIFEKPALRQRFNNVATAASITGAARSVLLRGLYTARNPIYADTDSIICEELPLELHPTKLGAWDIEDEYETVAIAGKKLYACRKTVDGQPVTKVRAKGQGDMTFEEICGLVEGESVTKRRRGVTIARDGSQTYLERTARATVGFRPNRSDIFGRDIHHG